MEINEIKKLAKDLHFELTDEEVTDILEGFDTLEKQLAFFEQINTDGVEEMIYPLDVETSFLREDIEGHVLKREEVLLNAPKEREGHISVPKVIQ